MLPVASIRAVRSDDGPFVVKHPVGLVSSRQHRLNAEHHPGLEPGPALARAEVRHIRRHVHGRSDSVADVIDDDARRVGKAHNEIVDGSPDVAHAAARCHGRDAVPHRGLGNFTQARARRSVLARNHNREGRVAVPAVQNGAAVERHQVSGLEHPLPRDSMNDLLVD